MFLTFYVLHLIVQLCRFLSSQLADMSYFYFIYYGREWLGLVHLKWCLKNVL